jgi:hypothetical protein
VTAVNAIRRAAGVTAGQDAGDTSDALVLGIWAPAGPALAFMREIGAALPPDTRPDPDQMRELYFRHASHLMP